jgi:hypothetical protein
MPQFQPPQQFPQQPPIDDDTDAGDEPAPNVVTPNPRGPVFNGQVPQQEPPGGYGQRPAPGQQQGQRPAPAQVPIGVAVPGMAVPAPAQPGQPGAQPGQPVPDEP